MYSKLICFFLLPLFSFSVFSSEIPTERFKDFHQSILIDTIPIQTDKSKMASSRDENKLISELEFYRGKAQRLKEQITIAEEREKSYKEQLEIINLNKVNYTLEYINKIQSEYNTNTALVKALKEEEKIISQKLNDLLNNNNSENQDEKIVPLADLQVSASDLPPNNALVKNKNLIPPAFSCKTLKLNEGMETSQQLLLNFTDPKIQHFLKGDNYISCFSKVSQHRSGTYYLSLTFSINSSTARKDYGQLGSNSACVVYLLSGETITLKNTKADSGRRDSSTGLTFYEGIYILDNRQVKMLSSNLISKIRVVWSTGYEDYEVQDLALIGNQIKCL